MSCRHFNTQIGVYLCHLFEVVNLKYKFRCLFVCLFATYVVLTSLHRINFFSGWLTSVETPGHVFWDDTYIPDQSILYWGIAGQVLHFL